MRSVTALLLNRTKVKSFTRHHLQIIFYVFYFDLKIHFVRFLQSFQEKKLEICFIKKLKKIDEMKKLIILLAIVSFAFNINAQINETAQKKLT